MSNPGAAAAAASAAPLGGAAAAPERVPDDVEAADDHDLDVAGIASALLGHVRSAPGRFLSKWHGLHVTIAGLAISAMSSTFTIYVVGLSTVIEEISDCSIGVAGSGSSLPPSCAAAWVTSTALSVMFAYGAYVPILLLAEILEWTARTYIHARLLDNGVVMDFEPRHFFRAAVPYTLLGLCVGARARCRGPLRPRACSATSSCSFLCWLLAVFRSRCSPCSYCRCVRVCGGVRAVTVAARASRRRAC